MKARKKEEREDQNKAGRKEGTNKHGPEGMEKGRGRNEIKIGKKEGKNDQMKEGEKEKKN